MQPSLVEPGLWIGDLGSLDSLDALGVTHVLSAINSPGSLEHPLLAGRQRLGVDVEDDGEANLLQHLPAAVEFIAAAVAGGGTVLVHCAQGVSRSSAVVMAHLMAAAPGQVTPALALEALRRSHAGAFPNPGFMSQLALWGAMGCALGEGHLPYKRFLLRQAGRQYNETGYLEPSGLSVPSEHGSATATLYRCRKCRGLVATSDNVVDVEAGAGATDFSWKKRGKDQRASLTGGNHGGGDGGAAGGSADGGLFTEPLRWMGAALEDGAVQGKLYCPRESCAARLGTFNWSGMQSASGAWVTPAFQLHLARLDAVPPHAAPALAAIRQPRLAAFSAPPATAGADAAAAQLAAASLADDRTEAAAAGGAAGAAAVPSGMSGGAGGEAPYFTHLILDCDGVLVDSERASCAALHQTIKELTGFEIPHDFPGDYEPVFGMDVRSCIAYYRQRFGLEGAEAWADAAALADAVSLRKEAAYRALTAAGIAAFAGVPELVRRARAAGLGVAIASSGSPEKIRHNLESSGLAGLVPEPELVVSAKYVARGKPAPDVYLEALSRLGCADAGRALVVEDAVAGLVAGRAAGCFVVGITNSVGAHLLAPHADLVVAHLDELDLATLRPSGDSGGASGSS